MIPKVRIRLKSSIIVVNLNIFVFFVSFDDMMMNLMFNIITSCHKSTRKLKVGLAEKHYWCMQKIFVSISVEVYK
jgi:hypothetical protein